MFIYPAKGRITSKFGKDILNGLERQHNGIDIAQRGTVQIVASAEGTVSRSYKSTSYGEVVFILHNINGQEYETIYAHMKENSRTVQKGDKVKQGEVLGIMGNTGYSFGQHLHFELHKGRWDIGKTKAVDPLDYLGKELDEDRFLNLHKHMDEWNHYATTLQPVKKNAHNIPLKPSKFGGLSYKIEGNPYPNVYTIKTGHFGYRNIFAPKDKDSSITNRPLYR